MTYSWLPTLLAEIAEVAGLDAALTLAAAKGGIEIYVPVRTSDDHWLVAAIGREATDKLCRRYPGSRLTLPLGPGGSLAAIRRTVGRMIDEGRSETEIARAVGYTTRGVRKRKAALRGGGPQGSLF
jgi:hypothetical protein